MSKVVKRIYRSIFCGENWIDYDLAAGKKDLMSKYYTTLLYISSVR